MLIYSDTFFFLFLSNKLRKILLTLFMGLQKRIVYIEEGEVDILFFHEYDVRGCEVFNKLDLIYFTTIHKNVPLRLGAKKLKLITTLFL